MISFAFLSMCHSKIQTQNLKSKYGVGWISVLPINITINSRRKDLYVLDFQSLLLVNSYYSRQMERYTTSQARIVAYTE